MKKIIFIQLFFVFCFGAFAQIKVEGNGKVIIGSTSQSYSNLQINIASDERGRLSLYDTTWGEKLRVTTSEFNTSLIETYYNAGMGFLAGNVFIGNKNRMYDREHGALNVLQPSNFSSAVFARTSTNSGMGVYSEVYSASGLAYASATTRGTINFYVNGDGYAYSRGILLTSDSILKKDIKTIQSPLKKIAKLRGVSYNFKKELLENKDLVHSGFLEEDSVYEEYEKRMLGERKKILEPQIDSRILTVIEEEIAEKKHFGLLAQDVEKVFPDLVYTAIDGTKAINYIEMIALLVEGMKEQQVMIEIQEKRLNDFSNKLVEIESTLLVDDFQKRMQVDGQNMESEMDFLNVNNNPLLYQNTPNPFTQSTSIQYYLPESVSTAYLCIYDLQGKQLKQITLSERGDGYQIISASEFSAGIYLYALITDGQEVDVKRMILTE